MEIRQSKNLYGTAWNKARDLFLVKHPLCKLCEKLGRIRSACVVDHITPHKGNLELFWDRGNWQPLCKTCHDSVKQAEERNGYLRGADKNGNPLDARHHWN